VLQRLYELDDHYVGSGGVYALTVRTVQRMRLLMNQASFDQATGQALLSITGEVTEHAGWLAFDAGRHAEARYWWLEALQAAHRANSNDVTTVALASMSLQAATQGRAHEAIDTVHAAQRAARARLTPRLRSILHARCGTSWPWWTRCGSASTPQWRPPTTPSPVCPPG
jgi:hypothetical protein